jgi:hypothetical protein
MENRTDQIVEINGKDKYYILRQALYKGTTYYLVAKVTEDGEDFTDDILFLERIDAEGKSRVKEVTDPKILEILAKNIKIEEE